MRLVQGANHRHPEQRDFTVCCNSLWADRLADKISQARDRYGFDGLYLDGTVVPWDCCNERHGCSYRAADGSLRPTYPIFAVRRLMHRPYGMFHLQGGLINVHQSTCCITPSFPLRRACPAGSATGRPPSPASANPSFPLSPGRRSGRRERNKTARRVFP